LPRPCVFLARREHSRRRAAAQARPRLAEGDDLEKVLDDLASRGWLSDVRFAELTARAKARAFRSAQGRALPEEPRRRPMRPSRPAFVAAGQDATASLQAIWASRFRGLPADEKEKARQVRFLQGRGFALDEIFRFLKQGGANGVSRHRANARRRSVSGRLHQGPRCFVIPNPYDAGSARLLQSLGFEALATSSGACAGVLGRRDGKVSREEALAHGKLIVEAVDLRSPRTSSAASAIRPRMPPSPSRWRAP
jgi:SOS response regulatory protein OraA/RecX